MPRIANIGPTGCGKTYQALAEVKRAGKPVLFINPKAEEMPGMVLMNGQYDSGTFTRLLRKGMNINYVPDRNRKVALQELDFLIQKVFEIKDIYVVFDEAEVHGYEGLAFSPLIDVAERGRSLSVDGLYLAQDPAGLSKRILRNCEQYRIFAFSEYSRQYFAKLGYDVPKMQEMLFKAPDHSYIIIERGEIKGIGRE